MLAVVLDFPVPPRNEWTEIIFATRELAYLGWVASLSEIIQVRSDDPPVVACGCGQRADRDGWGGYTMALDAGAA